MSFIATVTLYALSDDIHPQTRTIRVPTHPEIVPIGRASKSLSKGLVGKTDNAWFESPVMSRNHAQIFFDKEAKAIMIEDIGAMHGTRVNEKLLASQKPFPLKTDDTVVFGAEVRRGQEVFPACTFKVETSIISPIPPHVSLPAKPLATVIEEVQTSSNTFKCPYDSDFDFEEGENFNSDADEQYGADHSSDNYVFNSSTNEAIDLTHDSDSSVSSNASVFSVTSRSAKPGVISIDIVKDQAKDQEVSGTTSRVGLADCPVQLNDDEESEADYEPMDTSIQGSTQIIHIEDDDENDDSDDDEEDEFTCSLDNSSVDANEIANPEEFSEEEQSILPDCDYHNENGVYDSKKRELCAKAKGLDCFHSCDSCFVCGPDLDENDSSDESYLLQEQDGGSSERDSLFGDGIDTCSEIPQQLPQSTSPQLPFGYERPPSPSDAALPRRKSESAVESANVAFSMSSSVPVDPRVTLQTSIADDKSNFLEAMYANKATLDLQRQHQSFEAATADLKKRLHNLQQKQTSSLIFPTPIPSKVSFIANTSIKSAKSCDNQLSGSSITIPQTTQLVRASTPKASLKRKISNISEDIAEDNGESYVQPGGTTTLPTESLVVTSLATTSENFTAIPAQRKSTPAPEQRAAKRLKKFAEAAGYVTLGAVAAGAGLFSILVATAPDFA